MYVLNVIKQYKFNFNGVSFLICLFFLRYNNLEFSGYLSKVINHSAIYNNSKKKILLFLFFKCKDEN